MKALRGKAKCFRFIPIHAGELPNKLGPVVVKPCFRVFQILKKNLWLVRPFIIITNGKVAVNVSLEGSMHAAESKQIPLEYLHICLRFY